LVPGSFILLVPAPGSWRRSAAAWWRPPPPPPPVVPPAPPLLVCHRQLARLSLTRSHPVKVYVSLLFCWIPSIPYCWRRGRSFSEISTRETDVLGLGSISLLEVLASAIKLKEIDGFRTTRPFSHPSFIAVIFLGLPWFPAKSLAPLN